jgi:glycosyltransferase involved in cell wall biosynthesis
MFYIPRFLKCLDGFWVKRAVMSAVWDLERNAPIDLIDAHFGYPEGVGCVGAALALGKPVFVTFRGLESQILSDPWKGPQLRWAMNRCTGIICVSESLKDLAISNNVEGEKIRVIPNAVNRQVFTTGDKLQARMSLGIANDYPLIVSVGMLVHGKGHHLLVRALARLRNQIPAARVVLVGAAAHERHYPRFLNKLIADLGLGDAVTLAGSQSPEQVANWLRAADVFALPTFDEGCCNAILEAMACGLPVITTPVGDNAALVSAPQRGLIVPVDNVEKLALAMESALSMRWDRLAISRYGRDYSWSEAAQQTSCFFKERLEATLGTSIQRRSTARPIHASA